MSEFFNEISIKKLTRSLEWFVMSSSEYWVNNFVKFSIEWVSSEVFWPKNDRVSSESVEWKVNSAHHYLDVPKIGVFLRFYLFFRFHFYSKIFLPQKINDSLWKILKEWSYKTVKCNRKTLNYFLLYEVMGLTCLRMKQQSSFNRASIEYRASNRVPSWVSSLKF